MAMNYFTRKFIQNIWDANISKQEDPKQNVDQKTFNELLIETKFYFEIFNEDEGYDFWLYLCALNIMEDLGEKLLHHYFNLNKKNSQFECNLF